MLHPSGVQNTCRIFSQYPSVVQNTCRIGSPHPSAVQNTDPSRPLRPLRSPKNGRDIQTPHPPPSPFRVHLMRRQGRTVGKMIPYNRPETWGATAYAPQSGTIGPGRPQQIALRNNRAPAFVPLTGTSGGAYAIRPYPDGQKTETGDVGAYCIRPTNGHGRARTPPINHPTTQPKNHICPLFRDI